LQPHVAAPPPEEELEPEDEPECVPPEEEPELEPPEEEPELEPPEEEPEPEPELVGLAVTLVAALKFVASVE
jgi:hypothetical protein